MNGRGLITASIHPLSTPRASLRVNKERNRTFLMSQNQKSGEVNSGQFRIVTLQGSRGREYSFGAVFGRLLPSAPASHVFFNAVSHTLSDVLRVRRRSSQLRNWPATKALMISDR